MAQKRQRLSGGAASEEAVASSPTVLGTTAHGQAAGLQQYFSPPELSEFCQQALGGAGEPVLDVTAGDGSLLGAWDRHLCFGVEVDPDQAEAAKGRYTPLRGDLQRLYPLLRASGLRFPRVVANPPWGLRWQVGSLNGGKPASSTLLAYKMALGLLAPGGEGALITAATRFRREVEPDEDAGLIWCTIEVPDLFEGVRAKSLIALFAEASIRKRGKPLALKAKRAELCHLLDEVGAARKRRVAVGDPCLHEQTARTTFETIATEHERRRSAERSKRPRYDVSLRGKRLSVRLSAFAKVALRENEGYQAMLATEGFDRKALSYLCLNLSDWRMVVRCAGEGMLTIDPALDSAAKRALAEVERELCPLYEVRPQMRLGFLEDLERIRCRRSDIGRGFRKGESYPISTCSQVHSSSEERPYEKRDGTTEIRTFVERRKLLRITIAEEVFDEGKDSIEYLLKHFEIPDPGHIGERYPRSARGRGRSSTASPRASAGPRRASPGKTSNARAARSRSGSARISSA